MTVVDASVVVELLLNSPNAVRIARRLQGAGGRLHAPYLIDIEVTHAFRRFVRSGQIDETRGTLALTLFADIELTRYPHLPLLPRIWQLRHNLKAYDAAYVALAEALNAPLLTCDALLAAAPAHQATIELF